VLPRGVTFGCAAASIVVLIVVVAGGAWLASGGMVDFMDLAFGMSLGEMRGMYTPQVTAAQKKELEQMIESLRANVRARKVPLGQLQPVLQTLQRGIRDKKMDPGEVYALTAAARQANKPAAAARKASR
jgi:preprotein translocase subunit SecD